jgi:hypothetical protein
MMMTKAALTMSIVLCGAAVAAAAECQVPKQMKKDQKLPCVRAAAILVPQPTLTLEQLTNGPDFDSADPVKSRFAYFTGADDVACYFRPHYAFKQIKGQSLKFQCWHLDANRAFFSTKGDPLTVGEVKVVLEQNKGGENRGSLFERTDTANAHEIKADRIKVKYLRPAHPNHDTRFNEVFTEVAATRIMWALGFPADHDYPVATASCVGCDADPFADNQKDNRALLHDAPAVFKVATIERQLSWDDIDPENDETWSWQDAATFYGNGQFTRQQKVEYDAYRLALGLFTYHNAIDIQNRLACAQWKPGAEDPKICTQPMILVQDLGSTFGKNSFLGANPRGSFNDWKGQTVFSKPEACELRSTLDGPKQPLKEAQDLLITRLAALDRARVRAIFQVARFDIMDQKQVKRLRDSGAADVSAAALDEWTDVFMSHIDEIRNARNCKP